MTLLSAFKKQRPIFGCSALQSNLIWAIDKVCCTFLHNPFLSCPLTLVGFLALQYHQLSSVLSMTEMTLFNTDVYVLDIFHNIVNLVFIIRFVLYSECLIEKTNLLVEGLLIVLQEFGVAVLLLCPEYSLLYTDISTVLRVFIWWQILCPYLILLLNTVDFTEEDDDEDYNEKRPRAPHRPGYNLLSVMVETNNNMLPVFMAHSFATINFDFPFADGILLPLIYHIGVISIKLYIIYRFVLYEIVVVVLNITDLKSYAELYTPVQIGTPKKSWYSHLARFIPSLLIATTFICIIVDSAIIMLPKYAS